MYAARNHEIGYIQGMNYIAGVIFLQYKTDLTLSHKNVEEEAFVMLSVLMDDFGLAKLYRNGFEKL